MKTIRVIAPTRIDLAGGPSDVRPFSEKEWGAIVNCAINRYAIIDISERPDKQIVIFSKDLSLKKTYSSRSELQSEASSLRLIAITLGEFEIKVGLDVSIESQVPVGSGLGGSAAVSIGLLHALNLFVAKQELGKESIAKEAMRLENEKLGNIAGGQDQYASAFGGILRLTVTHTGISYKKLPVDSLSIERLNSTLLLCYSGISHLSGDVLKRVMSNYNNGDKETIYHLRKLRETAMEIESLISIRDIGNAKRFGDLLNQAWTSQKSLHENISTLEIERILAIALANGGTGGKVTGAGGGGCVLICCEQDARETITKKLASAGYVVLPFNIDINGVTTADYFNSN